MRSLFGAIYWITVGVLAAVGVCVSVLYDLPPYFLLAVLAMVLVGVWWPGLRYSWAALVGLGFLPALFLSSSLVGQVIEADWSCSQVSFQPGETVEYGGGPSEEEVVCATIPGQLIVASAVFWAAPIFGAVVLLYLLWRPRSRASDGETRPEGNERTTLDPRGIFVRVTAVLVGLVNQLVIVDPRTVFASPEGQPLVALFAAFLQAAAAGLLASEVVLRFGQPALRGGYFARYGVTVLGVGLGGTILGALYAVPMLLPAQPGGQIVPILVYGLLAALVGGVLGFLEGLILAFLLAAILGVFRRPPDQERGGSLPGVAVSLCLLVGAAVVSYAAAPTPETEAADLSDNPPLSCPEYLGEEIATFHGPGNQTTPTFETTEDGWGYETSSAGSGSLSIAVLDEDGNEVESPDEQGPGDDFLSGAGVGGAEFAFSGTFSLEIEADDSLEYEVLVCD